MADGLADRIKKLLRPVHEFRPGFGMGFGSGIGFMSQEDYSTKYGRLMPGFNWSNSKPHPDELDTPENRAAMEDAILDQEIEVAYRMGQMISSKELTALYNAGRGAKHQIDNGNFFSVEYDKFGVPTHVTLDFGLGDVWRSRVGYMSEAISAHQRARDAEQKNTQQDRRDQIRAAVFSPVLASLREARNSKNAEIYDFLTQVEVASAPKAERKEEQQPQEQQIRQVNVLKSHYISRDGNQTFESLKDHPAALRGHPDDTGVSPKATQLGAIRDVLRAEPEATVSNQSAALGQRGTLYYLTTDGSQLIQSTIVSERDEDLDADIDQPYDRAYDVENLKEIITDNQGVEWKEIDAVSNGFEPDPEQAALRLEVVERLREGDIESLNFEDEGVSFHLDGDKLVETWTNPDQSFAWDADKCDIPLYATDVQQAVEVLQQALEKAPYELTEQDHLDIAEAEAMAEEKQIEAPPVEFTPEELQEMAEEQKAAIPLLEAEFREIGARKAYEQDRERSVQEQIQENIEAGVIEDTDLYADHDHQALEHEQAWKSEEAYELQHAEQTEVLSKGRDREVFELYREAEYQHSEWMAGEREEAVDLSVAPEGVTDREWARAASDYKEWEQEHEENRQDFTNNEVLAMDQASEREKEERLQQEQIVNEVSHLRTPDGKNFVEHLRDRQTEGHTSTPFNGRDYQLDGEIVVSSSQSTGDESRAPAHLVETEITAKAEEALSFAASLQPAQVEAVSAAETQTQPELLNPQKTNDNQLEAEVSEGHHRRGSMADVADNAVARDGSEFSLTDVRDYARNKREESGQPLSPQSKAIQDQLQEHEAQSQSQRLTNSQRQ